MRPIRLFTSLAAAFSLAVLGSAAQAQPTQAQQNAAKATAANISGSLQGLAFQRDANGAIKVDANGKPISAASGNTSDMLRGGLTDFQNITGISGTQHLSTPTGGSRAAGLVKVNVNASTDFKCPLPRPHTTSAGGIALRVSDCDPQRGLTLSICDKAASASTCTDNNFENAGFIRTNVYSTIAGMQVGLACNAENNCRLTVKGSYTVGGNDETLRSQASIRGANAGADDSLIGALRTAADKGDYAGTMESMGADLKACADLNADAAATGKAISCDGTQTVGISTPQNNNFCSGTRQCLKESITVQRFNRTCSRTFPLTERITNFQYNQSMTCTITQSKTWNATTKSVETKVVDSCEGQRSGNMTRVGEIPLTCTQRGDLGGQEQCVSAQATEFFVNLNNPKILSQTASPSAVVGQCDTNPNSDTRHTECPGGNWFGRTLPASSCAVEFRDDDGDGAGTSIFLNLSFTDRPGCGVCLTPRVGETCYGAPSETDEADSCESLDLSYCSFVSATPSHFTGDNNTGLVSSQNELYECRKETKTCTSWSQGTGDTCLSTDTAMGLDRMMFGNGGADGSLNNALVGAALLDNTAKGIEGERGQAIPKIFDGEDQRCKRATGGIGQLLGRNCCSTNLERPSSRQLTRRGCSMGEAELAAARRSHYATYIGDYCSRRMKFPRKCLERTQTYCVFPGILPRLVQEQGRTQLAQMAYSGGSVATSVRSTQLNFKYYANTTQGAWTPVAVVNGVRVSAWQWPSYCSSTATANEHLFNDPTAKECPGVLSTWIAACDSAGGCGDLPGEPAEGSLHWTMRMLDPLYDTTSALSRYAVAKGSCNPASGSCAYQVNAWPIGVGGKSVVTRDLNWPLFSPTQIAHNQGAEGNASAAQYQMNNIGDLMFRGFSISAENTGVLPATVRLDFSRNGGQTWTSHQLPTNQRNLDFSLPNSDVKISGYCDTSTNICGYRMSGTTTITAKSWGSAKNPDCSGFTPGQLSALDFGKMDLSEWLDSVLSKANANTDNAGLVAQAANQVRAYNNVFSGGGTVQHRSSSPTAANFARVVPSEGFGPFTTRLVVSGYWPEVTGDPARDTDRVTRVTVNWGDCTAEQQLTPVAPGQGSGFEGSHRFRAPDVHDCMGYPERNISHKVKLTVYTTKSGVQTRTLTVENAWAKFPGGSSNNDFVGTTTTGNGYSTAPTPAPRP